MRVVWVEVALLVISSMVFLRMAIAPDNKYNWLWVALYWAVLCVKNAMEVLHD